MARTHIEFEFRATPTDIAACENSKPVKKMIRRKQFIPVLIVCAALFTEFGAGYFYFIRSRQPGMAVSWLVERTAAAFSKTNEIGRSDRLNENIVFDQTNRATVVEAHKNILKEFITTIRGMGSAVIVLYIPGASPQLNFWRGHYNEIAHNTDSYFVDMSGRFAEYKEGALYLTPKDGHPSRFANRLIASSISEVLSRMNIRAANPSTLAASSALGPLPANSNELWWIIPEYPYRIVADKWGFRKTSEKDPVKSRIRVLTIGDSFTFGSQLSNLDTYPTLLAGIQNDFLVLNAGIPGSGPLRQITYYLEKGQKVSADVVILQFNDGDIDNFMNEIIDMNAIDFNRESPFRHQIQSVLKNINFSDK